MRELTFKERLKINKAPLAYAIFKGVKGKFGALRFELKKAWSDTTGRKDEGCVFLSMAPATAPNFYDWENQKVTMALNISDIANIMLFLGNPNHSDFNNKNDPDSKVRRLDIYHDRGAGTGTRYQNVTTLAITKDPNYSNFFFSATHKDGDKDASANIPVSSSEALTIGLLLREAIPLVLAWWPDIVLPASKERR